MSHKFTILKTLKLLVVLFLAVGVFNFFRPLSEAKPAYDLAAPAISAAAKIAWPSQGQAAIGAVGFGILDATPTDQAVPIASIAKVMTALSVLKQKPLAGGQQGPTITLGKQDVAVYKKYLAENGSVVPVAVGEKITEYQALEAMLVPSANNIADSLAVWAFGSIKAYVAYANQLAKTMGFKNTVINDASGFSPKTVGTARDLVILGQVVLNNPVLAKIVSQKQAIVPVIGSVINTNWLLGISGINGIKTGHTDQSGGCYLFSSQQVIGGRKITLIGAIVGAPNLATAINDARPLIKSSRNGFELVMVASQDQLVGHYKMPWGSTVWVVAEKKLETLNWRGVATQITIELKDLKAPAAAGITLGNLSVNVGGKTMSIALKLKDNLAGPSLPWRIYRL